MKTVLCIKYCGVERHVLVLLIFKREGHKYAHTWVETGAIITTGTRGSIVLSVQSKDKPIDIKTFFLGTRKQDIVPFSPFSSIFVCLNQINVPVQHMQAI